MNATLQIRVSQRMMGPRRAYVHPKRGRRGHAGRHGGRLRRLLPGRVRAPVARQIDPSPARRVPDSLRPHASDRGSYELVPFSPPRSKPFLGGRWIKGEHPVGLGCALPAPPRAIRRAPFSWSPRRWRWWRGPCAATDRDHGWGLALELFAPPAGPRRVARHAWSGDDGATDATAMRPGSTYVVVRMKPEWRKKALLERGHRGLHALVRRRRGPPV